MVGVACLPRTGPEGIGLDRFAAREVVGPHAVVGAPPGQSVPADGVVEEGGVDRSWKYSLGTFLTARPAALDAVASGVAC